MSADDWRTLLEDEGWSALRKALKLAREEDPTLKKKASYLGFQAACDAEAGNAIQARDRLNQVKSSGREKAINRTIKLVKQHSTDARLSKLAAVLLEDDPSNGELQKANAGALIRMKKWSQAEDALRSMKGEWAKKQRQKVSARLDEQKVSRGERSSAGGTRFKPRTMLIAGGVAVLVLIIGGTVWALFLSEEFHVNRAADFEVTTSDGIRVNLDYYEGATLVLYFMDVDCPACAQAFDKFEGVIDGYGSDEIAVLGLSIGNVDGPDSDQDLEQYRLEHHVDLKDNWKFGTAPVGMTGDYAVRGTPTYWVLDELGQEVESFGGGFTAQEMRAAIEG